MPGEGGGGGEEQGDCHGQDGEQHLAQLGQDGQDVQGEGWYLTGVATRLMLNLGIIVVDER